MRTRSMHVQTSMLIKHLRYLLRGVLESFKQRGSCRLKQVLLTYAKRLHTSRARAVILLLSFLVTRHPENLFLAFQTHADTYCSPQPLILPISPCYGKTRSSVTRRKMFPA